MSDDFPDRQLHRAFGAIDEAENAYLVFEPKDPKSGLELRAVQLGPSRTLVHAEQLAESFNTGETWAFRINPGQELIGAQIPTLHRGP
jgi:hypothetical protein